MSRTCYSVLVALCGLLWGASASAQTVALHSDRVTVLLAAAAERSADLREFQAGGHGRFHVSDWNRPEQQAAWTIRADTSAVVAVSALVRARTTSPLRIEASANGATALATCSGDRWQRVQLQPFLQVPPGTSTVTLKLSAADGAPSFSADVLALELAAPELTATVLRADTAWMRQAKYGFMVHWTSRTCPRNGPPQSYADAVRDFDVERFAAQMKAGGAGFVVFTTAHAEQYFPAPLAALDAVLPGRTTPRDLVADLARALGARGLKLMLYHHPGAGNDEAWLRASGLREPDPERFLGVWSALIREAGERYRGQLAGWWFDDGAVSLYPRSPDWRALTAAARAGNPDRVVGYNAWEYPAVTPCQDFHCGEGNTEPRSDGTLAPDGGGRLGPGSFTGLQACATLVTEHDWGHFVRDQEIGPPRWSASQLRDLLAAFSRHGNVPIFNLEIYQDGQVSPATLDLFHQAQESAQP